MLKCDNSCEQLLVTVERSHTKIRRNTQKREAYLHSRKWTKISS